MTKDEIEMEAQHEASAWEEIGAIRRPVSAPQSTPPSGSLPAVKAPADGPATDREFAAILAPCLQLVAPVGMTTEAQDAWFEAARMALEDVPVSLLRRGAKAAMQQADHPAKVVPAIMAAIKDDLEWSRKWQAGPSIVPVAYVPEPKRIVDNSPLPFDQIRAMPLSLRKMGLGQGWVSQADFDRAAGYDESGDA